MIRFTIIALIAAILSGCQVVSFKQVSLYDVYEVTPKAEQPPAIVYSEAVGTMWNSLEDCGNFEISNSTAYAGKNSIKLDWNKEGCDWIGFGNSYANWTASDLSEERFHKALSFFVRTQESTAKAIPIVACLEDFSGGGSYHFIDAGKYLVGLEIDTTWKQIIVPLWDFPIIEDEVDIQSIKQVQFQLEGAGSFYIDEIGLIDYSQEQYDQMRAEVEQSRPWGEANQQVYTEGRFLEDAWGYEGNDCQTLKETKDQKGDKTIKWVYNSQNCSWSKWGINWNGWYPINVRGIHKISTLTMRVKPNTESNFKISFQDFKGHSAVLFSSSEGKLKVGEWNDISVSLNTLGLDKKGFVLDQIRQILFEGTGAGDILIDDIKISEL